jgi:MFS family permease
VLEAYGGEILKMPVGDTTLLTALTAGGALAAFFLSAALLTRGHDPHRLAATGLLFGLPAFAMVLLAAPLAAPALFKTGVTLIGFGGGMFAVSTLTAAMSIEDENQRGLALGAWGAVQATTAGLAIAMVWPHAGRAIGRLWRGLLHRASACFRRTRSHRAAGVLRIPTQSRHPDRPLRAAGLGNLYTRHSVKDPRQGPKKEHPDAT